MQGEHVYNRKKKHEYTSDSPGLHHPPVNQTQRGLKEGRKVGEMGGGPLLWGKAEELSVFSLEETRLSRESCQNIPVLTGKLQGG